MPYVPNAEDATQPTEEKFVLSAAEEFRKIKTRLNAVAGGLGAGVADILGGSTLANFTINQATPNGRVVFADTVPAGWNLQASSCYLQCEFVANSYFAANPLGHFALVMRCDTAVIATAVRGMGAAFGDLRGAQEGTQVYPGAQLETWANGLAPATNRFLFPNGASPVNKQLVDGVRYRVQIESVYSSTRTRMLRMSLSRENVARAAFDVEFDTGYVPDDNVYSDITKSGLVFGVVASSNLVAWSIDFSNVKVVWGPPPFHQAVQFDRVSRYGDYIEGDMVFVGAARRIKVAVNAGYNNWTAVQASTINTPTTLMVIPSAGSTIANVLCTNADTFGGAFGYVVLGMAGANATLETLGAGGHSNPPLQIKPGGTLAVTFGPGTVTLPTATKALAAAAANLAGPTNLDGVDSRIMGNNVLDYNALCGSGAITALLLAGLTAQQAEMVEIATRPLYGVLGQLLHELRQKKVI